MNEKTSNFGNADVSIIGGFLLNRVSQFLKNREEGREQL